MVAEPMAAAIGVALEHAYPLLVERYTLREGSGGAGRFRGGLGVIRDYRARSALTVSLSAERQSVPARGLDGGADGAAGAYVVNPGRPDERRLPSAVGEYALTEGDVLSIRTPGGAGFGPPRERERARVRKDLREGRITPDSARADYGLDDAPADAGVSEET